MELLITIITKEQVTDLVESNYSLNPKHSATCKLCLLILNLVASADRHYC